MEFALLLAAIYLFTFVAGLALEKFRIPWLFSALVLGFVFSFFGFFSGTLSSELFSFLGELGMYFLLFVIGFEIDVKDVLSQSMFYLRTTAAIIVTEAVLGALAIKLLFNPPLFIAFLVGLSFATVGEAVLIPILEEFALLKKPLGKAIVSIGILDDVFELITLIVASVLVGSQSFSSFNVLLSVSSLLLLFLFTYLFTLLKEEGRKFASPSIETLFVFVSFIFFLFVAMGKFADAAPLGALLAGIGLKSFLPERRLKLIESEVKTMCYGLFAPLFFVWAGFTTDLHYVFSFPWMICIIVLVAGLSKIAAAWLSTRKKLGGRQAILLGIGLCTRFSTSIVIVKYLFEHGVITSALYSVLVSSTAIFTISVPFLFSVLLKSLSK